MSLRQLFTAMDLFMRREGGRNGIVMISIAFISFMSAAGKEPLQF
jgi:hypothetical protein